MLQVIKRYLLRIIDDIDAGNTDASEDELVYIACVLKELVRKDEGMSKYQAYTFLGISRAKFDNMVSEGKLPKGRKIQGFKELRWYQNELLEHYRKQGKRGDKTI